MTRLATRPQVGRLHAIFAHLGITTRDERLRVLSAIVYRPVGSTNDLTLDEASAAIDVLDRLEGRSDAAEHLAELVQRGEAYLAAVTR